MGIKAYYFDDPEKVVSVEELNKIGVLTWKLDSDNYEQEGKLDQICNERGYNYRDFVSW